MFEELNRLRDDRCAQETRLSGNLAHSEYVLTNPIYLRLDDCARAQKQKGSSKKKEDGSATSRCNADGSVSPIGGGGRGGSDSASYAAARAEDDDETDDGGVCGNCARPDDFALRHRNLRTWAGGPGMERSAVDVDSTLRIDTHAPSRASYPQQLSTRVFHAAPDRRHGHYKPSVEARLRQGRATSSKPSEARLTPSERAFPVFHPTLEMPAAKTLVPSWPRAGRSSRDINRSPAFLRMIGYHKSPEGVWLPDGFGGI